GTQELVLEPDGIQSVLPAPILPDITLPEKTTKPDLLSRDDQSTESVFESSALLDLNLEPPTLGREEVDEAAALASVFASIPDVAMTSMKSVPEQAHVEPVPEAASCGEQIELLVGLESLQLSHSEEPENLLLESCAYLEHETSLLGGRKGQSTVLSCSPVAVGEVVLNAVEQTTTESVHSTSEDSSSSSLSSLLKLGDIPPFWVPDTDADTCMNCDLRFTTFKRRHHCHGPGNSVENSTTDESTDSGSPVLSPSHQNDAGRWPPNPNNPAEYCSTVPPWQQAEQNAAPPTVMVPVGVLKREGSVSSSSREPKQVMFSDGIRPGGDLTELTDEPDGARASNPRSVAHHRNQRKAANAAANGQRKAKSAAEGATAKPKLPGLLSAAITFVRGALPLPPLVSYDEQGDLKLEHCSDKSELINLLTDRSRGPVTFALTKNLHVHVKIVNLSCCVSRECWCFLTSGMQAAAQDEIMVLLERLPEEDDIPKDIFHHFLEIYERSSKGHFVMALGHTLLNQGANHGQKLTFLGSTDHGGFLYIKPTLQCLKNLLLPPPGTPYVVGLLLQKWELPWAKILPLRLALRLGAEFRYYPCPLFSVRNRKSLFCELGHTMIKLLADFRNYKFTVQTVPGLVIHMEEKQTSVRIPRNRYDLVMKVIRDSDEHVLAFAGNFSVDADSHLVCIQNDDGNYQTQAINIQNMPRKDEASALREMNDFEVGCGPLADADPDELVVIQWGSDDKAVNMGSNGMQKFLRHLSELNNHGKGRRLVECSIREDETSSSGIYSEMIAGGELQMRAYVVSPIDGLSFEGVKSVRIPSGTDYLGETRLVRWTELFLLRVDEGDGPWSEPLNISRMAEGISRATCFALIPHLDVLKRSGFSRIGLRATIDVENVCYEVGGQRMRLPPSVMNDMDSELIPIIHRTAASSQNAPSITLELIFHIMDQ
ncbi:unnamed protein product, partial [Notodromas monacha]